MDTITRNLYVIDRANKAAFEGIFTGYNSDEPAKKFDVTILNLGPYPPPPGANWKFGLRIHNLPNGCGGEITLLSKWIPLLKQWTYRVFYFEETGSSIEGDCPSISGLGWVSNNNNDIVIDYTIGNYIAGPQNPSPLPKGKRKFIGKRKK